MYIKSIVLDGFKSYGQRTEVNGFDPMFTAITGLNGSGKSNILDAICFVMGISNLSHVRATNLQDLIYKNGQAGVSKASVSITFDNSNVYQSPPGYENLKEIIITRQVEIGGKTKYIINGSTVANKKIHDLFCSVQLNVNNPHFLIMQGKITKVLNMKPLEILSMIEESAGTKLYAIKKVNAEKTIEKKDEKLNELKSIMEKDISPKLEKLRLERSQYLEFLNIERELIHMVNLYQVWQYFISEEATEKSKEILDNAKGIVDEYEQKINNNQLTIEQIDEEVKEKSKTINNDVSNNLIKEIEIELKHKEKDDAKLYAEINTLIESKNTEKEKEENLIKNLLDDENILKIKKDELDKVQTKFKCFKDNEIADKKAFTFAQKRFEALSTGMEINEQGDAETLQEQLIHLKQKLSSLNTENKKINMELEFCQNQIINKEKQFNKELTEYNDTKIHLKKCEEEIEQLQLKLNQVEYNENTMKDWEMKQLELKQEYNEINKQIENFEIRHPLTKFNYTDPEPNFNSNSILGVICRLIKVNDSNVVNAIETAAGGRLYNVVVDTDVTSKKLLQNGNLQYRTTFLPLNKIQAKTISTQIINIAENLVGKENVQPALNYLTYDKHLQIAMEYVFGNVFICKDLNIARKIAFDENILKRCVTLDGDIVDPSGTLSGGAVKNDVSLLSQLDDIKKIEESLKKLDQNIQQLDFDIKQMNQYKSEYVEINQTITMKIYQLDLFKKTIQQKLCFRLESEINNFKKQNDENLNKLNIYKNEINIYNDKIEKLEDKIKSYNSDDQLKDAEKQMNLLKEKLKISENEWRKHELYYETLVLEVSELEKTVNNSKNQIELCQDNINNIQSTIDEKNQIYKQLNDEINKMKFNIKEEKEKLLTTNRDIQKQLKLKEKLLAQIDESNLEIKKIMNDLKNYESEYKKNKLRQDDLINNLPQSDEYTEKAKNLTNIEGEKLEKSIRQAQEKKKILSKTLNTAAQSMIEVEEKQFNTLMKRYKIVEADKKDLLNVINELDQKKEIILNVAYKQISKDFGSIFATILPDASAKLEPLPGKSILHGIEIKVKLGNVWKENLSELSGGQRSLVALSLILSMLLFKPAPVYILDEVDAALDLSHTQNIGGMLKSHFKKSQFIIVSLKDGMFSNANVLFRTKFIDSVSAVSRYVNK